MSGIDYQQIQCPYCGEPLEVSIDCSVQQQHYIEDCQVCCCPIEFDVMVDGEGQPQVVVSRDDD